jgi:hypothetical protein
MTPQSSFMILAPIRQEQIGAMRVLLSTMNSGPGVADRNNALVPFARFDNLHSARFVVLDDQSVREPEMFYGVKRPDPPIYLVFLGDFDGSYDAFIDQLISYAEQGLRRIFSLCEDFTPGTDLRAWIVGHEQPPSAYYCNWVGRTVLQTREEEQLRRALREYLDRSPEVSDSQAEEVHKTLRRFVETEKAAKRLTLTPEAPTPFGWAVHHVLDWIKLILLVIGGIVTLPLTIVPLAILVWMLRVQEDSAPEYAPRPDPRFAAALAVQEDYDVTNQFSAMGPWKPGWLRAGIIRLALLIIHLTARTIYTKGRLTRIHTIHFARWVYMDNRTRVLFCSVYDGSLESYNDDFINKVSIGLNLIFGNGVGYPRTAWLILKGAKDEQKFKYFLRRHEMPTDVWYNAHAGLTAHDLLRNSAIRDGLERTWLNEKEAREWVALL